MEADEKPEHDREWLVEQRYRAVLEVLDGSPVSEVAVRYGVSRQSVYTWKARHAAAGIDGLREASRRPRTSPARLAADIEALVCELRRAHPRWGARRIAFEVAQRGVGPAPARATVHRVLVRNAMVTPQAQRHKRKYRRWQRETPMALWQLDLLGGIYLADGRECKLLSGIDDHSRYVVIAAVLAVPSARAVADAFTAAMKAYGIPAEVLTDNGKQFTGRFTKPRPAEVLFEKVCREHGITAKLTRPYSPPTTGKVERWHQTLRRELLDVAGPFADLRRAVGRSGRVRHGISASGVLGVLPAVQRIKLGAARAGQLAHVWADEFTVHVLIGGQLVKTVPSSLDAEDLATLRMRGASPAGPPPAAPAPARAGALPGGTVIEVDRAVDGNGAADLAGHRLKVGPELARRRVTLRLDGHLVHVICDGVLAKTLPSPVPAADRGTLRGARIAAAALPPPAPGPVSVQRKVPRDGVIMVTRQRLRVGATYAGKIVTVHVEDTHFRVTCDGAEISLHPRTEQRPVTRWKAKIHAPKPERVSSIS